MNKSCLILCLISLVMSAAYTDSAVNKKNSQSPNYCVDYFPYDEDYDTFCCQLVAHQDHQTVLIINYGTNMIKDIMIDVALSDSN